VTRKNIPTPLIISWLTGLCRYLTDDLWGIFLKGFTMWMTNPIIKEYIASITPERLGEIETLHQRAIEQNIPIIRPETEAFLKLVIALHAPKRILEIGTAVGYSALVMAKSAKSIQQIITLEHTEKLVEVARKNIEALGMTAIIQVIGGDAIQTMNTLEGVFDLIFIDAAKGQYKEFYQLAIPLLAKKGILIGDNILQEGLVAKSRYAIPRRQRTIHKRMRQLIRDTMAHPLLTTDVLPLGDGIMISYTREDV